ncbi:MAG: hypothetical protein FGF50_10655 [Candidatus Brockarchaeota archaeon]|nr:hypothetical protein [Candidatus Brockarchaeota archaeon]
MWRKRVAEAYLRGKPGLGEKVLKNTLATRVENFGLAIGSVIESRCGISFEFPIVVRNTGLTRGTYAGKSIHAF